MRWETTWRRRVRQVPPPLRLAFVQTAVGFTVAGCAVAAILAADFNGLGTLMWRSDLHPMPELLLWFFLGTGFSAVQIGIAVMRLGAAPPVRRDDPPLRPVPVRARRR